MHTVRVGTWEWCFDSFKMLRLFTVQWTVVKLRIAGDEWLVFELLTMTVEWCFSHLIPCNAIIDAYHIEMIGTCEWCFWHTRYCNIRSDYFERCTQWEWGRESGVSWLFKDAAPVYCIVNGRQIAYCKGRVAGVRVLTMTVEWCFSHLILCHWTCALPTCTQHHRTF